MEFTSEVVKINLCIFEIFKVCCNLFWPFSLQRDFLDDDCVTLLSAYHEKSKEEMHRLLLEWNYDYLTATYLLLLKRKTNDRPMQLGSHTLESLRKTQIEASVMLLFSLFHKAQVANLMAQFTGGFKNCMGFAFVKLHSLTARPLLHFTDWKAVHVPRSRSFYSVSSIPSN